MKCYICSNEIPEGKKCCPYCGRVITSADKKRYEQQNADRENTRVVSERVYKPAGTRNPNAAQQKTIHIPDIFSSDPNMPEYTDPHSYDRATADILEYDRQFVKGEYDESAERRYREQPRMQTPQPEQAYRRAGYERVELDGEYDDYDGDYYDEDEEYEQPEISSPYEKSERGTVIRDKKQSKPRLKLNVKMLIVCLGIIFGIVIIVVCGYQLGEQFGLFGSKEPSSATSNNEPDSSKTPETTTDGSKPAVSGKTGKYTVKTDTNHIFVYKSATDPRIIATIPNEEVIEITEVSSEMGKTTYNNYTGWVKLSDLEYTPDANGGSEDNTGNNQDGGSNSGDAPASVTYQTGTYTVTLGDDGPDLNIRSTASSYGVLVSTVPDGTELTVDEIDGSWGHITYNGFEGWVFMEYLK